MEQAAVEPEQLSSDIDLLTAGRPDLEELSIDQIRPIEVRSAGWPDSWRDIARSLYVTLLSRTPPLDPSEAATLATELMLGIAADLGGSQPYINQGSDLQRSGMAVRVMDLLRRHHQDYARVAQLVSMSERHVRRIEVRWLRAERARRQGSLTFD